VKYLICVPLAGLAVKNIIIEGGLNHGTQKKMNPLVFKNCHVNIGLTFIVMTVAELAEDEIYVALANV
jgi:hypothetical protein